MGRIKFTFKFKSTSWKEVSIFAPLKPDLSIAHHPKSMNFKDGCLQVSRYAVEIRKSNLKLGLPNVNQILIIIVPRTFRLYEELEKATHAQLSDQSVSYGLTNGKFSN